MAGYGRGRKTNKKSGVPGPEIRKWLDRIKYAEKVRNDADERFGYSRSLKEYSGDYISTLPTFMTNTALVPINEVFGYVKAFIPSVYSRNPYITFNPRGAASIGACKALESLVNGYWSELRLKRQIRRCIFDAIFAEGWFKTGYSAAFGSIEPEKEGDVPLEANEFIRDGEIFGTRVSWRHMVRDPDAVDGIHDARWIAQKIIKPIEAVRASPIYTAKDIRPTSSFDPRTVTELGKARVLEGGEKEEFIEFWEVWDMDSNELCWVSEGCDEYLRDSADWPYGFDGYGYDLLRFNQLEDECYAPNLIGPWEPQLWEKIKIRSMQLDHIKRFNRQLWAKSGTVSDAEMQKFALGQTGAVNFFEGDIPPQPAPYPPVQTDMYAVENRIDLDKDNISGQPNAVRSAPQKTQSRTLGEINTMIAAFQARQVDPQSDVEDFCGEIAVKIAAIAKEYLPGEKFVRAAQEDIPALVQAFGQDRFDGTGFRFTKADLKGAEFDEEVKAGSTLPLDRAGRIDAMVNILKLGPSIGIQPGDRVSKVIGKNLLSDFDMKEIELAFDRMLAEMEAMKQVQRAGMRLEQVALEDKIGKMRGMVNGQAAGGPIG